MSQFRFLWSSCFVVFLFCSKEVFVLARPTFMQAVSKIFSTRNVPQNMSRKRPDAGGYLELMRLASGRWSDDETDGVVHGGDDIVLLPGRWFDREPKWTWEKLQAATEAGFPDYFETDSYVEAEFEKENKLREVKITTEERTFNTLSQTMLVQQVEGFPVLQSFLQNTVLAAGTRGRLLVMDDVKKALKRLLATKKITLTEGTLWIQCFAHLSAVDKREIEDLELEGLIQYALLDLKTRFRPISGERHLPRRKLYALTARLLEALQRRATKGMNYRTFPLVFNRAGEIPWTRELLYPEAGIMTFLNDDLPKFQRWFVEEEALLPHLKTLQKFWDFQINKEKAHEEISQAKDVSELDRLIRTLGRMCRKDNLKTSARTKTATISLLLCIERLARVYRTDFQAIHNRVLKELMELISDNENDEVNVWWHDFKLVYFSLFFNVERLPLHIAEGRKLMKVTRATISNLVEAHGSGSHPEGAHFG